MAKKQTKKTAANKKSKLKNKKQTLSILNPKRRIGVAFLTFIATTLVCISIYSGASITQIARQDTNNVLGTRRQNILTVASRYAWSVKKDCAVKSCAKKKSDESNNNKYNGYWEVGNTLGWSDSSYKWSDCSCFVGYVVKNSAADSSFPMCDLPAQIARMNSATNLYTKYIYYEYGKTSTIKKSSILAGDIIVIVGHHTMIAKTNGGASNYTASAGGQVPNSRGDIQYTFDIYPNATKYVYRVKG